MKQSTLDIYTARSSMLGDLKRQDSLATPIIEEKRNDQGSSVASMFSKDKILLEASLQ